MVEKEAERKSIQSTELNGICIEYDLKIDPTFSKIQLCVVPIQVQGTKNTLTFQFLVDTGAQITILSPDIADAVGITKSEKNFKAIGIGGKSQISKQASVEMIIGQNNGKSLPLGSVKVGINDLSEKYQAYNILGILGATALQKLCLKIDYIDQKLEFFKYKTVN